MDGYQDTQHLPLAAGRGLEVPMENQEAELMFLVIKGLERGGCSQGWRTRGREISNSAGLESQS